MLFKRNSRSFSAATVALACLAALAGEPAQADIINVPDDYPTIQEAIAAAENGDEVVVAEGEYLETIDFLGKVITVRSTDPEDPGVVASTIINGGGAGTVVTCERGEAADTALEGFTITNGFADYGGGMLNSYSSPSVSRCTFTGNSAGVGGGMGNWYADPWVNCCTFTGNSAESYGGGMYNSYSRPGVVDCIFTANTSGYPGGGSGMANRHYGNPTVLDCTLSKNTAEVAGGGMFNYMHSSPTIANCTFTENSAEVGGAISNSNDANPRVSNCTFSGNLALKDGGGMKNRKSNSPVLFNCTFSGNSAGEDGGGIFNTEGTVAVENCTFDGNWAALNGGGMYSEFAGLGAPVVNCTFTGNSTGGNGGAIYTFAFSVYAKVANCTFIANSAGGNGGWMYNVNYARPAVANCTFAANTAELGGGMYNDGNGSNPTVTNCILRANGGGEILNDPSSFPVVTFCNVQGGYEGDGNIDVDPLFVDPENGDCRLSPGSPCIDAGDNSAVPPDEFDLDEDGDLTEPLPYDLDGNSRFVDDPDTEDTGIGEPPIVDMGAYEYQVGDCPADFDDDGDVDTADLLFLLGAWGTPNGDVDGDGDTDTADLLALLGAWGECP